MARLVVGSTALHALLPSSRVPKDLDTFSDEDSPGEDSFWDSDLAVWLKVDEDRYATLDELYTIKCSHAYWDPIVSVWNKHMFDVVMMKDVGAKLLIDLHDLLYPIWMRDLGPKQVKFSQGKKSFFTDAVTRIYDHDSIHVSVSYGERPMYESVLSSDESVKMDMNAIWSLSFEDQVKLFREEIYTTALERILIPRQYDYSPRAAYMWALRRTITSLTKGRSARFIVDNYKLFRDPDMKYVDRHLSRSDKLIKLEMV